MRKLALVMAVAMASGRAYALGLGDIDLHSALNEPLNAEIRIITEQPSELNDAVVRLAPSEEFNRAGIERPAILSDLHFTIVKDKDGKSVVKITSTQPIREPFLDFVVQMRWQSGRLLREYTVLLDPPVFGGEKPAPVEAPMTAPAAAAATPQPLPQAESPGVAPSAPVSAPVEMVPSPAQPAPAAAAPPTSPVSPQSQPAGARSAAPASVSRVVKTTPEGERIYGPTRRNDTLWDIAKNLRPDDSISVYQMMMALLKKNPEAFYNDNVNALKAGYVLRVPDKATAAAVNNAEAVKEAARQYESWKQSKRAAAASAGKTISSQSAAEQTPPARSGGAAPEQEKETARLRLVAPGEVSGSPAPGDVQAEIDKLRGELSAALESSDTAKRESDELRSRVTALEGQISSLQRLLTLKDQALSEMQKRSGMEVPQAAQTPATPSEASPTPAKPSPAKPATKEQPSDLFANPTLVAALAGAGVLLLAVLWLVMRRRRGAAENDEPMPSFVEETTSPPINIQLDREERAAPPVMEEANDSQMDRVAEEVAQHAEQDIPQAASDLDVQHTSEGEIDPIVEADVYLAYRRYQQAEALIQTALAKEPHRHDLQAKLLEIYYASKNADAFQTVAESLYENLGHNPEDALWQRILPMGRELCPEHELFRSSLADEFEAQQSASTRSSLFEGFGGQSTAETTDHDSREAVADTAVGFAHVSDDQHPSQEEKMDFDLNLGETASAAPEQTQETSRSLSADLDFETAPAAAKADNKTAPIPERVDTAKDKAQRPWEVDSAMSDFGNIDFGLDDTDLLAGTDVVGTKLDLARAYIDMGDNESAHDILKEVAEEGSEQQKQEAKALMENIA